MKAILTTLALLALPVGSPLAIAQSDGTLGTSSTGTLNFNVKINDSNRIQIFGFRDVWQTIEQGEPPRFRGNSLAAGGESDDRGNQQLARPCITADLPGTRVSLDWVVTPLTNTADDTHTLDTDILFYRDVVSELGVGNLVLNDMVTSPGLSGSIAGTEAKTGGHGQRCDDFDKGRLAFAFEHPFDSARSIPIGTYVATIKITVKPE